MNVNMYNIYNNMCMFVKGTGFVVPRLAGQSNTVYAYFHIGVCIIMCVFFMYFHTYRFAYFICSVSDFDSSIIPNVVLITLC